MSELPRYVTDDPSLKLAAFKPNNANVNITFAGTVTKCRLLYFVSEMNLHSAYSTQIHKKLNPFRKKKIVVVTLSLLTTIGERNCTWDLDVNSGEKKNFNR